MSGGQRVARVEERRRARAARILPLRLGRQAVGLAFLLREPLAERHGLRPGDGIHRVIVRAFALAKIGLELPELSQRDLGGCSCETAA